MTSSADSYIVVAVAPRPGILGEGVKDAVPIGFPRYESIWRMSGREYGHRLRQAVGSAACPAGSGAAVGQ